MKYLKTLLFLLFIFFIFKFFMFTGMSNPTITEVDKKNSLLIDVRSPEEFLEGSIKSAINIPVDILESKLSLLDKNKKIIVFCASGNRSGRAKTILEKNGFKHVINGGAYDDLKKKYP